MKKTLKSNLIHMSQVFLLTGKYVITASVAGITITIVERV